MGLDDVTAIVIACPCGVRFSMSPDEIFVPERCPNNQCAITWGGRPSQQVSTERDKWPAANLDLIDAIKRVRRNQKNGSFEVLLEFNEQD
jgi:hypothetical protein